MTRKKSEAKDQLFAGQTLFSQANRNVRGQEQERSRPRTEGTCLEIMIGIFFKLWSANFLLCFSAKVFSIIAFC